MGQVSDHEAGVAGSASVVRIEEGRVRTTGAIRCAARAIQTVVPALHAGGVGDELAGGIARVAES